MDTIRRVEQPGEPAGARRPLRMTWLPVVIVVLLLAGAVLWFFAASADEPTATFDGTTATYSGPTSFEAGPITFTFDATEYDFEGGVAFVIVKLTDESLTMADLEALADEYPASTPPPGVSLSGVQITFAGSDVIEQDITLTEGTWSIWANTAPQATNRAHPAAIIEITGS